jgi:DNA/RNA endonuclease G (NUC1)
MFARIKTFLMGKKTYIVAGLMVAIGIVESCGVEIPEQIWAVLVAALGASVRAGAKKIENAIKGEQQ